MMSYGQLLITNPVKFVRTSKGNMGCKWCIFKQRRSRRRWMSAFMESPNIIINCCLGCVQKWLQQSREALLSWDIQVMGIFSNSLLLIPYLSKGLQCGVDQSFLLTQPIWVAHIGGVIFGTTYDANDSMFPLAFCVMSLENYENWFWFLQNLKKVVGDKEVVIISDRHPTLLRSVPKVFGLENHAYCYDHLKGNFSSLLSKYNTRGNKGK